MKHSLYIWIALLCLSLQLHANVKTESLHFLTTEAGVGYSSLLNQSVYGSAAGLAGAKLQVGYEWRYRRLLVHTGLEFASINGMAKIAPFTLETPYTVGLPAGQQMLEHFDFQAYRETQMMGQINLPVQLGGIFDDRYYFLAGLRLGLPVLSTAKTQATVTTYLTDPSLIGELDEVPVHDAFTSDERAATSWAGFINAQVSAEVGLVLNPFFEKPQKSKGRGRTPAGRGRQPQKKPILFRVALFADYGINACARTYAMQGMTDVPMATVEQPRQIRFDNYISTARTGAHSLLVGAKFAVLFQLNQPKPQKPPQPLPSYFDILIADAVTNQPIPASLNIYDKAKKRAVVKEAKKGRVRHRVKDGNYTITASNEQYISQSQDVAMAGEGRTDTIYFALQPKPQPVITDTPVIAIPIKVGAKVVLHNMFFATNQTRILPQSEEALNDLASFMEQHPGVVVRITGHTDNVGSETANQRLSEGRAQAVRDELIRRGIASDRIEAEGKGESEPIADNATEDGRARNRRVEFTIIATGGDDIEQIHE